MAELPYQTWARIMGTAWPTGSAMQAVYRQYGITAPVGSAAGNVALQRALIAGRPAAAPSAARPAAPRAATAAAPKPSGYPGGLFVQPGLFEQLEQERIALQKYIADLQNKADVENLRQQRFATETQLSANPADYVAYELYKRKLQGEGYTPQTGAARSNADIRGMFESIVGPPTTPEAIRYADTGQFGVPIPKTQEISNKQFQTFDPTDLAILSSFLKGGVQTGGKQVSINPEDYFKRLQEGFVPSINTGATKYSY